MITPVHEGNNNGFLGQWHSGKLPLDLSFYGESDTTGSITFVKGEYLSLLRHSISKNGIALKEDPIFFGCNLDRGIFNVFSYNIADSDLVLSFGYETWTLHHSPGRDPATILKIFSSTKEGLEFIAKEFSLPLIIKP